eukprot:1850635-Rhodomonas_salina.2
MLSTVARTITTSSTPLLRFQHSFQLAAAELSLASSSITTTKKLLILWLIYTSLPNFTLLRDRECGLKLLHCLD